MRLFYGVGARGKAASVLIISCLVLECAVACFVRVVDSLMGLSRFYKGLIRVL